MEIKNNHFWGSKKVINVALFVSSVLISSFLYFDFFINMLPRYFNNMESIEKNILAYIIVVISVYIFMKILFRVDKKFDIYILLSLYFIVVLLGLLRPDINHKMDSYISWNPFGFISESKSNETSFYVMVINLIIFLPMYFLLTYAKMFNSFMKRFFFFEFFIFLIEFMQYKLHIGIFDLSDILLYNIGFFFGVFVSFIFMKLLNLKKGTDPEIR